MRVDEDGDPTRAPEKVKSGGALRIALVFPPAVAPTSPPLGIAELKGYLQSTATVEVRTLDLNLAYFEQAFQWLRDGRLRMSIQKMDAETTARKVTAAINFFRGYDGPDKFFDLALYNEHAKTYAGFSSVLNGLFDNFARKILLGLPVPCLASRFFDDLLGSLEAFRPDLTGFSILFSQQLFFALALAKLCKGRGEPEQPHLNAALSRPPVPAKQPRAIGAKIVLGGATFSVMPDPGRLLTSIPVYAGGKPGEVDAGGLIDYLIVGEGEKGLEALAESALRPNANVPGLVYVKDGKVVRNPAEAVSDLNALPLPDFSDLPPKRYHSPVPVLPYLSSRGCPWRRCAFCTHQKTYLEYREEDAATTAGKISALQGRYGVSHFCLVDEMVKPRRMERIAGELMQRGLQIHFSAYARPAGFPAEVLEKAHRAGLCLLMWGVESASPRVLDLMCKGTKAQEIETILKSSQKAGIWNLLFVIFGFPTETKAEWLTTLDFLDSCRESIHALSRSRFILLEGSDVFCNPQRYGIKRIIDRARRDPVSIAFDYEVTEGLTHEEAADMFRESLARLSGIGRSPQFGQFREHMLLFASRQRNEEAPERRLTPQF